MDTINQYKTQAEEASKGLSDLSGSAPGMLAELKKNLVGIFSKDNPVMAARETALSDYLSSPDRTRAEILPINLPQIEGSQLNLSPTQQNAIVSARQSAALAPLAGLNQIITGQYGNIGDIVQGAASGYTATIDAAKTRVANLIDLYKTAVAEQDARTKAAGSGGFDLGGIIAAIRSAMGTNAGDGRPDISQFDEPEEDPNFIIDPITGTKFPRPKINPVPINLDNLNIPKNIPLNLNGYNFGSSNKVNPNALTTPGTASPFAGLGLNIDLSGRGYGF